MELYFYKNEKYPNKNAKCPKCGGTDVVALHEQRADTNTTVPRGKLCMNCCRVQPVKSNQPFSFYTKLYCNCEYIDDIYDCGWDEDAVDILERMKQGKIVHKAVAYYYNLQREEEEEERERAEQEAEQIERDKQEKKDQIERDRQDAIQRKKQQKLDAIRAAEEQRQYEEQQKIRVEQERLAKIQREKNEKRSWQLINEAIDEYSNSRYNSAMSKLNEARGLANYDRIAFWRAKTMLAFSNSVDFQQAIIDECLYYKRCIENTNGDKDEIEATRFLLVEAYELTEDYYRAGRICADIAREYYDNKKYEYADMYYDQAIAYTDYELDNHDLYLAAKSRGEVGGLTKSNYDYQIHCYQKVRAHGISEQISNYYSICQVLMKYGDYQSLVYEFEISMCYLKDRIYADEQSTPKRMFNTAVTKVLDKLSFNIDVPQGVFDTFEPKSVNTYNARRYDELEQLYLEAKEQVARGNGKPTFEEEDVFEFVPISDCDEEDFEFEPITDFEYDDDKFEEIQEFEPISDYEEDDGFEFKPIKLDD